MTGPREQQVLRWAMVLVAALTAALLVLTAVSAAQTARYRAAADVRSERTAQELSRLATSLESQAATLEAQAGVLADQAAAAERSRVQFRRAAREILERLGATVDAFDPTVESEPRTSDGTTTSEPTSPQPPEPSPAPSPTVEPEPAPGCGRTDRPRKCGGR